MDKTSVYTHDNGNIKELAHQKQQKSQKVILPASHWLCVNVLLNNITMIALSCQRQVFRAEKVVSTSQTSASLFKTCLRPVG